MGLQFYPHAAFIFTGYNLANMMGGLGFIFIVGQLLLALWKIPTTLNLIQ